MGALTLRYDPSGDDTVTTRIKGQFLCEVKVVYVFNRVSRRLYISYVVLPLIILAIIVAIYSKPEPTDVVFLTFSFVCFPFFILGSIPRLHDRSRSGWYLIAIIIPILGIIWLFVELCILKGTEGPNKFGKDPLQA